MTNAGPNIENRTYPRGLDVEVFSFDVLKKAFKNATAKYQQEHVTPYIYENSEHFKVHYVEAERKLKRPDIRITLDTEQDFELISEIMKHFETNYFNSEELIDFLQKHPELLKINKNVKQKSLTGGSY